MSRALLVLALLLRLAAAQAVPADPALPPTQLGQETLARSPVVAVTRVISVRPGGPGTDLVRVRLLERVRGAGLAAGDELALLVPQGTLRFGSEDLLFLRPWREGGRYELAQRVSAGEPHYEERLAVVRRTVWLVDAPDAQRRADATLDMLLALLASPREWTRGYAAAELRWMARERRELFTPERIARLRAAGRACRHADARAAVDSVASLLSSAAPVAPGTALPESSPP